ncbi:uncharacterized protein LOC124937049 [Impatiens glandulifera]|uniref:uncharacterized protein LOC124937049 n=1 Tax=Impatiens glandulifera TaxID=253017 RepID=UPI001FB0E942|nr:uncharacterized protein LOC124937049 [Impatiens glandulifera]
MFLNFHLRLVLPCDFFSHTVDGDDVFEVPVSDFFLNQQTCCLFLSKLASFSSFSTTKISTSLRKSSIAMAIDKGKKKFDFRSFVSKPDEAVDFFLEVVLLKEENSLTTES